jgi:hypothetical protein
MTGSRKEKGIAQLKQMMDRWEDADGEFRQYVAWRTDNLKLIGAGNTSGTLAIAVFLTTGTRTGGMVVAAKLCLFLFGVGFVVRAVASEPLFIACGSSSNDADRGMSGHSLGLGSFQRP